MRADPPVERISIPSAARARANGTIPVLSETEINARFMAAVSVMVCSGSEAQVDYRASPRRGDAVY